MVVLTPFDDSISNYPDLAYVYFFCRKFSTIFPQFTPLEIEKALTERGYPSLIILRTIIIVFLRNLYPNNVDSINEKVQENIKLIYGKVTHNLTLVDLMDCPIGQDSIVTDTKEEVEELIKSLNSEDIKEKRLKDKLENVILKYIDMANEPSEKKNEEVIIIEDDDDDENDDNNQSNDNDNKVFVKKTIEETTENFEKLLKIITVNNDTNKKSKENRETTLKREKEDNGNEKEKEKNNSRNTKRRRLSINKRILKLYIDGLYYSFNQLKEIMDSYCE
ncbi:hypothetical protein H8356DRAFT_1269299 [Neocallimastix lanati (nom. inval.)]|uniref:Uncharacterized protein n=1 Tax=Neocallimastix californiae TaxID=1754190 RepID=A0A1Y2CGV7_9FUNG|nr:hypothetical protein H8356DRAFT_1269299 [Neocallimastix sp. JGI-2020a]ORY46242.1 hypothetical protein LY90DRAFT_509251 [Neocallimastix californiae]|eukprot:ORY46242.1 hypothetical protein LY90DRAFT_509251 [Neocallimastix californiae]